MKKYNLFNRRLLSLMLQPLFFLLLIVVIFILISKEPERPSWKDWISIAFFSGFFILSYLYLFFNHLKMAKKVKLKISSNNFLINDGIETISADFLNIKQITEFSSNRLPWRDIMWWQIEMISGERAIVSSLTISKSNFDRYFYNKIVHKFSFFPLIRK